LRSRRSRRRAHPQAIAKDGKIPATWGSQGLGPAVRLGARRRGGLKGAVYAADTYSQRIQKFVPATTHDQ
jgi:hypothetical protein